MLAPTGINTVGADVPFASARSAPSWCGKRCCRCPTNPRGARLDGASEPYIVYRILGPLLAPTLTAMFLFSFVYHYSDYFWPLVMTTDDANRTLPLAIALLREQGTGERWHVIMAGNVILSLPVLVVFAFAQRHIVRAWRHASGGASGSEMAKAQPCEREWSAARRAGAAWQRSRVFGGRHADFLARLLGPGRIDLYGRQADFAIRRREKMPASSRLVRADDVGALNATVDATNVPSSRTRMVDGCWGRG